MLLNIKNIWSRFSFTLSFYHWWSLTKFGVKCLATRSVTGWCVEIVWRRFSFRVWSMVALVSSDQFSEEGRPLDTTSLVLMVTKPRCSLWLLRWLLFLASSGQPLGRLHRSVVPHRRAGEWPRSHALWPVLSWWGWHDGRRDKRWSNINQRKHGNHCCWWGKRWSSGFVTCNKPVEECAGAWKDIPELIQLV